MIRIVLEDLYAHTPGRALRLRRGDRIDVINPAQHLLLPVRGTFTDDQLHNGPFIVGTDGSIVPTGFCSKEYDPEGDFFLILDFPSKKKVRLLQTAPHSKVDLTIVEINRGELNVSGPKLSNGSRNLLVLRLVEGLYIEA